MLVIARYNEDISWVQRLKIPYKIYNKGDPIDGATSLPNVGREAHTYLTYIVENYDSLPDKVFFTQGNYADHAPNLFERIDECMQSTAEFESISELYTDRIYGATYHAGLEVALTEAFQYVQHVLPVYRFSAGAIFMMTRNRIRRRPLTSWRYLLKRVTESESLPSCWYSFHKQGCPCRSPYSAWVLERLWYYL